MTPARPRRGEAAADEGAAARRSPTPAGDALGDLGQSIDRFVTRLRARLAAGAREYGDRSFTRPPAELVDEVMQELEDVAGWSLLLWLRLDRLRGAVEHLDVQRRT